MNVNKKHKNSVFSALFSTPEKLRELYSAIEGIDVPPDAVVEINTLSDVLFMEQINDVSFTIDDRIIVLIEHQSTLSGNVPLRLLMYIARVYEKIIDRVMIYKKKLVKIPKPEFIVLYNGIEPFPDRQELRLSSAFKGIEGLILPEHNNVSLELVVQVYNINHGRNREMVEKSETLNGYSTFVEKIREYSRESPLEESIATAIKYCIEHNTLKEFLKNHGMEVINMLCEEPPLEEIIAVRVEEAVEEIIAVRVEEALEKAVAEALEKAVAEAVEKSREKVIKEVRWEAMEEGRAEGWESGRENGQNYILELLEQGLSIDEIKMRLTQTSTQNTAR